MSFLEEAYGGKNSGVGASGSCLCVFARCKIKEVIAAEGCFWSEPGDSGREFRDICTNAYAFVSSPIVVVINSLLYLFF